MRFANLFQCKKCCLVVPALEFSSQRLCASRLRLLPSHPSVCLCVSASAVRMVSSRKMSRGSFCFVFGEVIFLVVSRKRLSAPQPSHSLASAGAAAIAHTLAPPPMPVSQIPPPTGRKSRNSGNTQVATGKQYREVASFRQGGSHGHVASLFSRFTIKSHSAAQVPSLCFASTCSDVSIRPPCFGNFRHGRSPFQQFPGFNRLFGARRITANGPDVSIRPHPHLSFF